MPRPIRARPIALALLAVITPCVVQSQGVRDSTIANPCPICAEWNAPQRPFRIFGNSYYVGTHGLGAILVTSPSGHVLIDGGLPESAAPIAASIRALGFRIEDVRVILNSHVHFDHAGGVAELQRLSGAEVLASARSVPVLRSGNSGPDDPQYGVVPAIAKVARVSTIPPDDTVRVGALRLRALHTGGHTPGGTSWSWTSCEGDVCWSMVYGDSQTAISADGFLYSRNTTYPTAIADFHAGLAALEAVACDVIVAPHPEAVGLWDRLARREGGERDAMRDPDGCKRYAAVARKRLASRLEREGAVSK